MDYTEQFKKALDLYERNPENAYVLDGPYWTMIASSVGDCIHDNNDLSALLKDAANLFDYGICKEYFSDESAVRAAIEDSSVQSSPLPLYTLTTWIEHSVQRIRQFDKKDFILNEQKLCQVQINRLNAEIQTIRSQRNLRLIRLTNSHPGNDYNRLLQELEIIDELQITSLRNKKALSRGVFFSVNQKRDNANLENKLMKANDSFRSIVDSYQDKETVVEVKGMLVKVAELTAKIIEIETQIDKTNTDLAELEKKQADLSPIEIENQIKAEIEQIRDLVRLSAKRLHSECNPVLLPEKKHFTYKTLIACFDRILEFDPKILKNDRVNIFGKPQIILVPGNGSAIYDWKNNVIIVPIIYNSDNPMLSIATGMIEYRLDTDEDKMMQNSFNQLPEMKAIKSSLQLKAQLIKDYNTWMTSEYQGFRILPKHVKDWFEHEIGPNKNEIFIPPAYQPFNLSSEEFNKLLKGIDERVKRGPPERIDFCDLWIGSILFCIHGNLEKAFDLLIMYLKRDHTNAMAFYNFGIIAAKLHRNSRAIKGYTEFVGRAPQSWWTRVATDHIRQIQQSGVCIDSSSGSDSAEDTI
jgi:hypothetical protein